MAGRNAQTTSPDDDRTHPGAGGAQRLIAGIVRRHWPALGGAAVSTVLMTLADLAQPWPLKFLIDNVISAHSIPFTFSADDVRQLVFIAAAGGGHPEPRPAAADTRGPRVERPG